LSQCETYYLTNKKSKPLNSDRLLYIITLIKVIPLVSPRNFYQNEWVILNSRLLKNLIGDRYREYLDFWIKNDVIQERDKYKKGIISKGYRFKNLNDYMYPTVEIPIKSKPLLNSLKKHFDKNTERKLKTVSDYEYLTRWFNPKLKLHYPEKFCKCDFQRQMDNRINRREFSFFIDSFGHRLHTSLTNLSKELRPFVSYDDQALVELDIKAAQPYMALKIIFDYIKKNRPEISRRLYPENEYNNLIAQLRTTPQLNGLANYIEAVNSDFYSYIQQHYLIYFGYKPSIRDDVKKVMFEVLFSKNESKSRAKSLFKNLFQFPFFVLSELKNDDYKNLARLLQNLESDIILNKVCRKISDINPEIPIFTVHDAILTTHQHLETVQKIMFDELTYEIGFEPNIRVTMY